MPPFGVESRWHQRAQRAVLTLEPTGFQYRQWRLVDLTFLRSSPYVLDALTHASVLFDLLFAMLIWNRLARPLLIGLSVVVWTSVSLITGLVGFAAIMVVANLAFVPSEAVAGWFGADTANRGAKTEVTPTSRDHVPA